MPNGQEHAKFPKFNIHLLFFICFKSTSDNTKIQGQSLNAKVSLTEELTIMYVHSCHARGLETWIPAT